MDNYAEHRYLSETKDARYTLHSSLMSVANDADRSIGEILEYANVPRKYLCAMMVAGAYQAAGGTDKRTEENVVFFSEAVNLSWMLIDDIVDGHDTRFAKASARIVFGSTRTLLASMYLLSNGYARLDGYSYPSLVQLGRTYHGWLRRDVVSGKSLDQCRKTLEDLGSSYGTLMRVAAEIAGAPRVVQDNVHNIGLDMGYAVTLISECFDLNGSVIGRPIAEELKHGNDIFLVKAAEEDGIFVENPDEAWLILRQSKAFLRMVAEIENKLAKCETSVYSLPGPVNFISVALALVREQLVRL